MPENIATVYHPAPMRFASAAEEENHFRAAAIETNPVAAAGTSTPAAPQASEEVRIASIRLLISGAQAIGGCTFQTDGGNDLEAEAIRDDWTPEDVLAELRDSAKWFARTA